MADEEKELEHGTMPFLDHLEDLRTRLIYSLIGMAVMCIITFWYGRDIVLWLCQPLFVAQDSLGLPRLTTNHNVAGGFLVYMKVAIVAALALASPWVAYQLWKFISPGLHVSERRMIIFLAPFSSILSFAGILFLYYIFLPATISFLLLFTISYPPASDDINRPSSLRTFTEFFNKVNSYFLPESTRPHVPTTAPATQNSDTIATFSRLPIVDRDPQDLVEGMAWFNRGQNEVRIFVNGGIRVIQANAPSFMLPLIEVNEYLNLVLIVALITVIAFQLPVVMVMIGATGLIDAKTLAKYRLQVVFGCFVVGVIATPQQDAISNFLFPMLLWALFEVGLIAMRITARMSRKTQEAGE